MSKSKRSVSPGPQPNSQRGKKRDSDDESGGEALLNSPRTREACRREGFDIEDVMFRSKNEMLLAWGPVPEDIANVRWQTHEKRRQKNLKLVLKRREEVVGEKKDRDKAHLQVANAP